MIPKDVVKGKKFAVYLRRSEGESGSTKAQLTRISKQLNALEKATGRKINRTIVGKDINKKRRFNAKQDLAVKGDVFNEGEQATGFKTRNRPVLMEMVKRIQNGDYDGIVVESFDRISRDILGLAHFALPLWREDGKIILDLSTGKVLGVDREEEALLGIVNLAGSLTKVAEIKKSKEALKTTIDDGYLTGSRPEFLGSGTKNAGLDYRKAWALMQAYGESFSKRAKRVTLDNSTAVGKAFNKDNKWAGDWYDKMKAWNELGVLDTWLDNYDAINAMIRTIGKPYTRTYKRSVPLNNVLYASRGFFAYPAGVLLKAKDAKGVDEFVVFPDPLSIGFDRLSEMKENASELEDFVVERTAFDGRELAKVQTQPRAR